MHERFNHALLSKGEINIYIGMKQEDEGNVEKWDKLLSLVDKKCVKCLKERIAMPATYIISAPRQGERRQIYTHANTAII